MGSLVAAGSDVTIYGLLQSQLTSRRHLVDADTGLSCAAEWRRPWAVRASSTAPSTPVQKASHRKHPPLAGDWQQLMIMHNLSMRS